MKKLFILFLLLLPLTVVFAAIPKDAILNWSAPTTNTDGTPVTDLAGYRVYCGTVTGIYPTVMDVGNITSYKVSDILTADKTYYCAITAYDFNGNESAYSNEVTFPLDRLGPVAPTGLKVR